MEEMSQDKASLTVVAMSVDCPTCAAKAEEAAAASAMSTGGNGGAAGAACCADGGAGGAAGDPCCADGAASESGAGARVGAGENDGQWHPKLIAFCCYYCAYSAADLAGSMRLQYSPDIRVIEMPCSGKTDVALILEAFEQGADGVYVAGCLEGDCHFLKGNFRAKKRVNALKKLLDQVGVGGERVEFFNLAGSMGPRFAEIANEMTERILKLGPSPVKTARQAPEGGATAAGAPIAQTNSEVGAK